MRIGIIGEGAIGSYVRRRLDGVGALIVRPGKEGAGPPARVSRVADLPAGTDLVLD